MTLMEMKSTSPSYCPVHRPIGYPYWVPWSVGLQISSSGKALCSRCCQTVPPSGWKLKLTKQWQRNETGGEKVPGY